jgi:hypothetical protein
MVGTLRLFSVVIAVAAAAGFAATGALAAAVPMDGEFFQGTPQINVASCSEGATATMTYTVSDGATGPYTGTYTESGTITFGPLTSNGALPGELVGPIQNVEARFTINSALGMVTGDKRTLANLATGTAACLTGASSATPGATADDLCYTATLPDGSPDSGTTNLSLVDSVQFSEIFASTTVSGCAQRPATADECKNGAWTTYDTLFKNQGDCVAFVETDGKNEPGQNVPSGHQ